MRRKGNPDDPPVRVGSPTPGDGSSPGHTAVVDVQIYIASIMLIAQLWLVTDTLREWLSGHREHLWLLAACSGVAFAVVWAVKRWPGRSWPEKPVT